MKRYKSEYRIEIGKPGQEPMVFEVGQMISQGTLDSVLEEVKEVRIDQNAPMSSTRTTKTIKPFGFLKCSPEDVFTPGKVKFVCKCGAVYDPPVEITGHEPSCEYLWEKPTCEDCQRKDGHNIWCKKYHEPTEQGDVKDFVTPEDAERIRAQKPSEWIRNREIEINNERVKRRQEFPEITYGISEWERAVEEFLDFHSNLFK